MCICALFKVTTKKKAEEMDTSPAKNQSVGSGNNSLGLLTAYGSSDSDSDSEITDDKHVTETAVLTTRNTQESTIQLDEKFTSEPSPSTEDTEDDSNSESDCQMQSKTTSTKKPTSAATAVEPASAKAIVASSEDDSEADSDCEIQSETKSKENEPAIVSTATKKFTGGPYREVSSDDGESYSESDSDLEIISHGDLDEFLNASRSRTPKGPKKNQTVGEEGINDLPPIEDLQITVTEDECIELGKICSIVEQLVLVDSLPGTVPLNLDTVLFLDKGNKALGQVFDVLGNVASPLYCVRFNSNDEIKTKNIEIGTTVYVAPRTEHTTFVCISDLMQAKKSDASKENDNEHSSDNSEYSDDEMERQKKSVRLGKSKPRDAIPPTEAYKYMRGSYRSPRGNRGQMGSFRRPPRGQYPFHGPARPPPQHPDNFYYSWHSNYQYPHPSMPIRPLMFPNPYAMPPPQPYGCPYIPPNVMQQPLFPPPPPPPVTKTERYE